MVLSARSVAPCTEMPTPSTVHSGLISTISARIPFLRSAVASVIPAMPPPTTRTLPTAAMSVGQLPADPAAQGAAHDQLLVGGRQPGQLLGEHRHALAPCALQARDVGAPEHAL